MRPILAFLTILATPLISPPLAIATSCDDIEHQQVYFKCTIESCDMLFALNKTVEAEEFSCRTRKEFHPQHQGFKIISNALRADGFLKEEGSYEVKLSYPNCRRLITADKDGNWNPENIFKPHYTPEPGVDIVSLILKSEVKKCLKNFVVKEISSAEADRKHLELSEEIETSKEKQDRRKSRKSLIIRLIDYFLGSTS